MTRPENNEWVRKLARAGYAAKGVVYGLIGGLALQAAFGSGGQYAGGQEAVQSIEQTTFGKVLLVLIGVGMLGYALWRAITAVKDPEGKARDGAKGVAKRVGWAASALMNGAIGVTALTMVIGQGGQGGNNQTWVAKLMAQPFGQFLVGAIGVALVGVGIQQIIKGYKASFMRDLNTNQMNATERTWSERVGRVGLAARGIVFGIVGTYLVKAAITHNPGESKGVGEALASLAGSTGGVFLLIVVAAGLVAYGAHMLMSAKYRKLGPA